MIFWPLIFRGLGLWRVIRAGSEAEAIEARIRAGDDRFHEEQRSYAAYPSQHNVASIRRRGWLMVVASLVMIVLLQLR